jgi:hypothetical protein
LLTGDGLSSRLQAGRQPAAGLQPAPQYKKIAGITSAKPTFAS